MKQLDVQEKSVEALKLFNNTIVTCRLYPPEAPQVANTVDRGYKGIKLYLRTHGELKFALVGETPYLCGRALSQEVLDLFPNLVVYRQLRLLGLAQLGIRSEMDRFAFAQLLAVFNASVDKIKKEGGGLEYVTSLGLASYFPEQIEILEAGADQGKQKDDGRPRNLLKVRPEVVACLFGEDERPVLQETLRKKMADPEEAIDVFAACIARILKDIQQKKMIVPSPQFPLMQERAEALIETDSLREVALGLAGVLVQNLKEPALCVLLTQEFTEGFGGSLYNGLISFLTKDKVAGMMKFFRERLAKVKRIDGPTSAQVQSLETSMTRLLNSEKGKLFLSAEKAKTLISEGEKERKKRRIEAGLRGFLQGNTSFLKSEELVEFLPTAVRQFQKNQESSEVSLLLGCIVSALNDSVPEVRRSLLKSMTVIGENLLADDLPQYMDMLLAPLMEQVRRGGLGDPQMEKSLSFLQQVMQKSWRDGDNTQADSILTLLYQIRSGQTSHSDSTRAIVAKVQDKGIRRATLPKLLAACLADPKNEALSYRLILQGPVALRFLVDSLITTENSQDRFKIIDLLTCSPHFLPTVVHERLPEHMAWYGKRNLIKLLGESGTEEDAESLLPYLRHDDFRVQREAFLCIYKLAGKNRKLLLLKALEEATELLRIQIIGSLAPLCDPEVAAILVELLASHDDFSEKNKKDLLLQLLGTLGRCPCPAALKGVNSFLQTRGQRATRKIPEQVWAEAEKAMKFLHNELQETRKKHLQASKLRKTALKQVVQKSKTAVTQRVITGLPQEQTVRTLLSRGDKNGAVEQLLELIERVVRLRNFVQAEQLHEWLVEIDSTALSQILKAAEIIDQEKVASIDKSHLEIWGALYDALTTDEFTALYHALKHNRYENEKVIISQGDVQGSLYFINSGKVKLYFNDRGSEVLVKTMGKGEIFGGDAFFEASVSTISVAAITGSDISVLNLDVLASRAEEFPELDGKLHNFCKKSDQVDELIKQNSMNRRLHERYQIAGRVMATLFDNRGRAIGSSLMVELCDISEGGMSLLMKTSMKENDRLLLGRKLQLELPEVVKSGKSLSLIGEILAVKRNFTTENDCSLHVKFDAPLDHKLLHEIVLAMRLESQMSK